jgi:Ca2+-transporting ATPase
VNSSDSDHVIASLKRLSHDKFMHLVNIATFAVIFVILYTPLGGLLSLAPLGAREFLYMLAAAVCAVFWYEIVKAVKRVRASRHSD